jgi:uncharacterized protein (DUF4213/DUF364 family)
MNLLEKLIRQVPENAVDEVIVGVHSVLVKSGDHAGIASTIKYCSPVENVRHAGMLETMTLNELALYALSSNLLEASIGMAAINCAINRDIMNTKSLNAKTLILEKGKNKKVGIIGHFPFLEEQKDAYKACYIFEKHPRPGDLKEEDIPKFLPTVDVAAITATSITNHTFEDIIRHLPKKSYNIILGPSTPLSTLLFDYGMHAVSGSVVTDYGLLRKHVLQATPTRYLPGLSMISIVKEGKS